MMWQDPVRSTGLLGPHQQWLREARLVWSGLEQRVDEERQRTGFAQPGKAKGGLSAGGKSLMAWVQGRCLCRALADEH